MELNRVSGSMSRHLETGRHGLGNLPAAGSPILNGTIASQILKLICDVFVVGLLNTI